MTRVIIIAFLRQLDSILSLIKKDLVEIAAIVTIVDDSSKEILKKHNISCRIFSIDYLSECIDSCYFDYVIICEFEQGQLIEQICEQGVKKNNIINMSMLNYPDMITLIKLLKNYIYNNIQYEITITGMSYAYYGTDLTCFSKLAINLSGPSQDLYYDYKLFKYIVEKRKGSLRYAIIGLAPYSFHYDLSLGNDYRILMYYPILQDIHNYTVKKDNVEKIFNDNFLKLYEMVEPQISFDINDRLGYRVRHNNTMNLLNYFDARKRAEAWKSKTFPKTVTENILILSEYISFCNDKNILPIITIYPLSNIYCRWFPKKMLDEFYFLLRDLQRKFEFEIFDYLHCDLLNDNDFFDVDHLNIQGAKKVSNLIDSQIVKLSHLNNVSRP